MMNRKTIDDTLCGSLCLLVGWGIGTLVHEGCHLLAAGAFGLPATLGACTLSTGSVFIHGGMTDTQTALIALAGSLGLVVAGVALVRLSSNPAMRMIGVVFLCRAWVDVVPIVGSDGGLIAGSAGYVVAILIVVGEVLICGDVIIEIIAKGGYANER